MFMQGKMLSSIASTEIGNEFQDLDPPSEVDTMNIASLIDNSDGLEKMLRYMDSDMQFLSGGKDHVSKFFGKEINELSPHEILTYSTYRQLLHLKSKIVTTISANGIPLTHHMRRKLDEIYNLYHETYKNKEFNKIYMPYFVEEFPIAARKAGRGASLFGQKMKPQHPHDAAFYFESAYNDLNVEPETTDTLKLELNTKNELNPELDSELDPEIIETIEVEDSSVSSTYKKKFSLEDSEVPSHFRFESTFKDPNYTLEGPKTIADFDCEIRINNVVVELNEIELDAAEVEMDTYWRNRIYQILHNEYYIDKTFGRIAMFWYLMIMTAIFLSVFEGVCDTIKSLEHMDEVWYNIEMFVTCIFSVEIVIKLIIVRNRCLYLIQPSNVIDWLAILPFYLVLCIGPHFSHLDIISGVLRTLRILRVLKAKQIMNVYVLILGNAVRDFIFGAGSAVACIMVISCLFFGSLIYTAESTNPDSGFDNILFGMWYTIVTMSTVGYGDISPTTGFGYFVGLLTIVAGIVIFSLILMVTGQYYIVNLEHYKNELQEIKILLFDSVYQDGQKFRKVLATDNVASIYDIIEVPFLYMIYKRSDEYIDN